MIFDAAVHAAYVEKINPIHRKKKIQCRYCLEFFRVKHTNRQRQHLIKCAKYHAHLKQIASKNFSTLAFSNTTFTMQISLFPIISKSKRKKLNKLTTMTIYCDNRFLSMFENSWMKNFFLKNIDYKSSKKIRISENLLNKTYARTKATIMKILDSSSMLNIVMNENDNQTKKKIPNMCVLIQNHQFFHVILKSIDFMQLNVRNEIDWIIHQIDDVTTHLSFRRANSRTQIYHLIKLSIFFENIATAVRKYRDYKNMMWSKQY